MEKQKEPVNDIATFGASHYHIDHVRNAYAKVFHQYHQYALSEQNQDWWDVLRAELNEGDIVLDLGCGTGVPAAYFENHGINIIGVDTSQEMLDVAKTQAPNAIFFHNTMQDCNFRPNAFDGAYSFFSFLHLPKEHTKNVLHKLHTWLRASAPLAITLSEGEGEGLSKDFLGQPVQTYISYYTRREVASMLEQEGFDVEDIRDLIIDDNEAGLKETQIFLLAKNNK
jgi:cyclopropane fatty-acyl-phospholipid synthase-like methyltransferase